MNIRFCFLLITCYTSLTHGQTADFSYQVSGSTICAPSTLQFQQKSSGNPLAFIWTNGSASYYEPSPLMIFANAGIYTVQLKVFYRDTTISVSRQIEILPAFTAFVKADRSFICKPGNIDFTAGSNGTANTYTWNFNDGSSPVSETTGTVTHFFGADSGFFTPTVTVKSVDGCIATAKAIVSVKAITVVGRSSLKTGCIPVNVRFNASVSIPANSTVLNYSWDYKDGTPVVNSDTSAVIKKVTTDTAFYPVLTVTTSEGCTGTFDYPLHNFGARPLNMSPMVNKLSDCASATFTFFNKPAKSSNYLWVFNNDRVIITDTSIGYVFDKLGTQNISFTPINKGCPGKTQNLVVTTIGVVADFTVANTCKNRNTFVFADSSQGNPSSFLWRFGNVVPNANSSIVTRTFPLDGVYQAILEIKDNITGCKSLKTKAVYTASNTLIADKDTICVNSSNTFQIKGSFTSRKWNYEWHLFGQTLLNDTSATKMASSGMVGIYKNYVVASYGDNYCPDTIRLAQNTVVTAPKLGISAPASICIGDSFKVVNLSSSFLPGVPIISWQWDFGDSTAVVLLANPPVHLYSKTGLYSLKLSAADLNGCRDSLKFGVKVRTIPFVKILHRIDTVCLGNENRLIAVSSDSILWQPANLFSCSNCDTTLIKPTQSQRIYATAAGNVCPVTDSMEIKVYAPFTASAAFNEVYLCPGDEVQFSVQPTDKKVVWSPGADISNINVYNPLVKPLASTVYTATLSDSANCFQSAVQVRALLKKPPLVDAGTPMLLPYNAPFTFSPVYSNNIVHYSWTPPANINCLNCPVPSGNAITSALYTVTVESDSGCVAKDTVSIRVQCSDASLFMASAFTPNSDNLNDYYYPLLKGVKKVLRFTIYNRYGQIIFEAKNFNPGDKTNGWNGKHNGIDQPASNYQYSLDAICEQGELIQKKGTFTLIR